MLGTVCTGCGPDRAEEDDTEQTRDAGVKPPLREIENADGCRGLPCKPEVGCTGDLDANGVVITGIKAGSPAAEANLSRGDVLLEVDRKPVRSAEEASRLLSVDRPGGHVLLVQRGDSALFLLLQPGAAK